MRSTGESWGTWPPGRLTTPPGATVYFFPLGFGSGDLDGPFAWALRLLRPIASLPPAARA